MIKKYIAEVVGTFALAFVVLVAVGGRVFEGGASGTMDIPLIAGLTLGLFVYTIGPISGSHVNPAVTLGALSLKKISLSQAVGYIVAQFIGALIAMKLGTSIFNVHLGQASEVFATNIFIAEIIGTFFFTFGIASVVLGTVKTALSGAVIGGSLLLGILMASLAGSAGILNPAVAFTLNSMTLTYILAPIVGSVLGMQVYKAIN